MNAILDLIEKEPLDAVDILEANGYAVVETATVYGARRYLFKKNPDDFFGIYIEAPALLKKPVELPVLK